MGLDGGGRRKRVPELIFVNDEILGCFLKRRVFKVLFVGPQQLVAQRGAFRSGFGGRCIHVYVNGTKWLRVGER